MTFACQNDIDSVPIACIISVFFDQVKVPVHNPFQRHLWEGVRMIFAEPLILLFIYISSIYNSQISQYII